MSERAALLRNIIDNPDDDAARLVMADWLDDHNEADRAEFVRLQVSLAQEDAADAEEPFPTLTSTRFQPEYADPSNRERTQRMLALFRKYRFDWPREISRWSQPDVEFCRGFIHEVQTSLPRWLKGAAGWHQVCPITHLIVDDYADHLAALARRPQLAHLASLTLNGPIRPGIAFSALAESQHAERLRSLSIKGYRHYGPDAPSLLGFFSAPWTRLQQLTIEGHTLSRVDLVGLASNAGLASLRALTIPLTGDPFAAGVLADTPYLPNLTRLQLVGGRTSGLVLGRLLESANLPALSALHLTHAYHESGDVLDLADEPGVSRLRTLDLSYNHLYDTGARRLAKCPHLGDLRRLDLRFCGLETAGVTALADSPNLAGLRRLLLIGNRIGPRLQERLRERFGWRVELSEESRR